MMAAPTESLRTEGVRTLEVRWIFPGELASAVAGWFARFAVALPGGLELGVDDSRFYAQWLCPRPQALGLSPEPDDR